mgnify:CR=1 FL=1|tara:strand:+ start:378 stop:596 length:219 start_codon:yes stop_codon:yes gene_type:complete
MSEIISLVRTNGTEVALFCTSIIAAAAAFASMTKTPEDDKFVNGMQKWYKRAYRVINLLAFNFGHAKEKKKE